MNTPRFGNYIEPGYTSHAAHLSDSDYASVLDSIVISCVDIVMVHDGRLLLGKRAWLPQAGWWVIGGRLQPGEALETAAARCARRETGLTLEPGRFRYLTAFSTAWRERRLPPTDHGTHTTSLVTTVDITAAEAAAVTLNEEYSAHQWLTPAAVLANPDFHPALHQCAAALSLQNH